MKAKDLTLLKASELADLFSTLSDASRVRIVSVLMEGPCSVGELVRELEMSESAVSHQLRWLRQTRLVRGRRQGRQIIYSLEDNHVEQLFRMGLDHVEHS
jgi:DNA-binding transcriptional ArsR family regulator